MKLTAIFMMCVTLIITPAFAKIEKISNIRVKTANGHFVARERKLKSMMENLTGGDKAAEAEAQRKYQKQKNTIMLLSVMSRQRKIKKISHLVENLQDSLETLKATVESQVGQLSSITQAASAEDKIMIVPNKGL